ncbi:hypothetical protein WMY93_022770 [Mugilogobius chulae]|uniref:Retinitis pigmentosa 1-like 1 protein n=1 Tax=Mugilogobius chulae TaxID=88201 RepID=A0AAW0N9F3_9GOBI
MSTASVRSQRNTAECKDRANESSEQASKPEVEDDQLARAKSRSPETLRPISGAANSSRSCRNKKEKIKSSPSPQNASRPASKADTCSESILSHSLSAADLAKETKAAELPGSPRSKLSNKSAKSKKEVKEEELTPSCLPNASPNEVVSDWLNRIPADMLALGDEDGDKCAEDVEVENAVVDEVEVKDEEVKVEENEKEDAKEEEEKEEEERGEVEKFEIRPIGMVTETSLPKSWESSTAVMKVLLSSSLGRCRSMPEVSPVYGRRLSASAKELLDCLTQLQLIEPAGNQTFTVQKDQRPQFEDIISILQTLWLADPRDTKDSTGTDQVSPPRSSSGVGMSSGSGGSGKDNANQEEETKQEAEAENKTEEVSESPESPKATDNPSSLERNPKTPTDNELETHESSSCESPPTALRAPLSKRQSQDPDPMWVLRLLKKLEKQFINHYVTAMDDFKVKWDLEDSLILDRMIVELRDEVSQRIEKSVEKEMKKIQGRAGKVTRVPRPPPGSYQSTDSTVDKRRRLLKVMKNHSVKTGDSVSDGELTGENSDQRSDDEYCPCEACIAKKMAARPVKTNPNAAKAPVQKEFDLFKILQFKTAPPAAAKTEDKQEEAKKAVEEDARNLEVVKEEEEEEETSEDLDTKEGEEEAKCHCQSSKDDDDEDEETEESDKETVREKSSHKEETMEEATGAEEEEGGEEETSKGEESEEVSTEERASEQPNNISLHEDNQVMTAVTGSRLAGTEGEDADVEDSEEKSDHDAETKTEKTAPKHQFTRTSVESQPGSLEDIQQHCPSTNNIEVPKLASPGGTPQKRSRSPARVKRRKAINSDSDLDNI